MAADIRLGDDSVTIEGSTLQVQGSLGVGTAAPQRPLHVETGEVHSGGDAGGFSFASRTKGGKNFFPEGIGDRWVLYADVAAADVVAARLWTSGGIGDVFSVRWNGQVFVGGGAAGYSFGDQKGTTQFVQNAKNGERWTWYAKDKVARLKAGKDLLAVTLDGKLGVNLGANMPQQQLQVEGGEIHSGGAGAGFSFSDRKVKTLVATPAKGERWVWYADQKTARLWSGTDKLTVTDDGMLQVGNIIIGNGVIVAPTGVVLTFPSGGSAKGPSTPEMIDLVASVVELRAAVAKLQQQVKALGGKP